MKKSLFSTAECYKPYIYKGLSGRYMYMPAVSANAKRTFVVLYGQHATLERIEPIVSALTEFGDVYAVDYPGFGGMEPSYKIGESPTLTFFAGYLKKFIDEVVPDGKAVTLLGISYGFQLITETLNQYPELHRRVEEAVSFVGFVHYKDFHIPRSYSLPMLYMFANLGRTWLGSKLVAVFMQDWIISGIYTITKPIQPKFKSLSAKESKQYMAEQAWLWRVNDVRTHAVTAWSFCKKNDLTAYRINVPVIHIGVPKDHLVDNVRVAKELGVIYADFKSYDLHLAIHAPLDVGTRDSVLALFSDELRQKLLSSRNDKAAAQFEMPQGMVK